MAPRLLADPIYTHWMPCATQECLDPIRRRELKAWSLVEGRLQPNLEEAMAGLRALSPQPAAEERQPQADSQVPLAHALTDVADAPGPADEDSEAVEAHGSDGAFAEPDAARASRQGFDLFGDQPALTEALGASFEVRSWKPSNGPQLFETLARLCKTVVFPEDADDEV